MTDIKNQIITKERSLTAETENLLNKQIEMEGTSSAYYLAMASWCDVKGYVNSAQFLYKHAEEERLHMLKIFSYVHDYCTYHNLHSVVIRP